MKFYLNIFTAFIILIGQNVLAQDWVVPADKAKKVSSFKLEQNNIDAGQDLYNKNCKSCHGDPTKGNFIPLNPIPSDLGSESVQLQKDGELFYKITEGRMAMPSFKDVLSDNDRWSLIAFIRSFNEKYIQPPLAKAAEAFKGEMVFLDVLFQENEQKFVANVSGLKKGDTVAVEGVKVKLAVERYFGNLAIGDVIATDTDGNAIFDIPNKLPGDKEGMIKLIAKLVETDRYGEVEKISEFKAGVATHKPSLTEERAIWNVSSKAPWWIYVTYPVLLLSILGTIGYVLFQVYKIYKLGKN